MTSIKPHGGKLINRVANEAERKCCLQKQQLCNQIIVNTWTISDFDLIGVGAFSPLTGFMNEDGLSLSSRDICDLQMELYGVSQLHSQLRSSSS